MRLPGLKIGKTEKRVVHSFGGLDFTDSATEDCFSAAMNVCTDRWPALSVREKRRLGDEYDRFNGVCCAGKIYVADGTQLYVDGEEAAGLTLTDCEKVMVPHDGRVYIFPDKKWVSGEGAHGDMELSREMTSGFLLIEPALTGYETAEYDRSATQPTVSQPSDFEGRFWLDSGSQPCKLKKYVYDGSAGSFVEVEPDCARIAAFDSGFAADTDLFDGIEEGDGVTLSGSGGTLTALCALGLEGSFIVQKVTSTLLVLRKRINSFRLMLIDENNDEGVFSIDRRAPDLDFAVSAGNRIWGCSVSENRIYASRLDCPCSWYGESGSVADALSINAGTDSPFTAASVYMGNPVFFKENAIHKIIGLDQSVLKCAGVQSGCSQSVVCVGDLMYYKSPVSVMAYGGSMPYSISSMLGRLCCESAVAGTCLDKYYLFLKGDGGERALVYDTVHTVWYEEDSPGVLFAENCGGPLALCCSDGCLLIVGGGEGTVEDDVAWYAESGDIRAKSGGRKILERVSVRAKLDDGARASVTVSYDDSGDPVYVGPLQNGLTTFTVRARRCDSLRLRIEGVGGCRLISISRTYSEASEL